MRRVDRLQQSVGFHLRDAAVVAERDEIETFEPFACDDQPCGVVVARLPLHVRIWQQRPGHHWRLAKIAQHQIAVQQGDLGGVFVISVHDLEPTEQLGTHVVPGKKEGIAAFQHGQSPTVESAGPGMDWSVGSTGLPATRRELSDREQKIPTLDPFNPMHGDLGLTVEGEVEIAAYRSRQIGIHVRA